jgi:hypothetical protein
VNENAITCKKTGEVLATKPGGGTCTCSDPDQCALALVTDGKRAEVRVVDAIAAPTLYEYDADLVRGVQETFKESGVSLKVILGSLSQLAAMCIMQGKTPEARETARNSHFVTVVAYIDQFEDMINAARPPDSRDH